MTEGWRVGHKDILAFMSRQFNITTWRTVVEWKRRGMPNHRLMNGKPYIIESEVVKWATSRTSS
jgi:hypothetical protein